MYITDYMMHIIIIWGYTVHLLFDNLLNSFHLCFRLCGDRWSLRMRWAYRCGPPAPLPVPAAAAGAVGLRDVTSIPPSDPAQFLLLHPGQSFFPFLSFLSLSLKVTRWLWKNLHSCTCAHFCYLPLNILKKKQWLYFFKLYLLLQISVSIIYL